MMLQQLIAAPIQARTKGELKQLRKTGWIPVSIQHRGEETLHLQQEARPLNDFIHQHGEAALLDLQIQPGKKHQTVIVHDIQRDPITQRLLQVTFQKVVRGEAMKVHIPLHFVGEPQAVRDHTAIVQHSVEVVEVRCMPQNIPDHITVDISDMNFGDTIRVSDLPASDHYEILTAPDTVLASLVALKAYVEAEIAAETKAEETELSAEAVGEP
jgi:large subunit ribosomal protein L25